MSRRGRAPTRREETFMKTSWKKYVVGLLSAGAWLGQSLPADAAQVCWISYSPQASTVGTYGSFTVGMGTPTCSVTNNYSFCSTGATSASCDASYLYREAGLFAMYAALLEAKANAWDVTVSGTYLGVGTSYKGKYFTVNP
jgi:hypothetical protein